MKTSINSGNELKLETLELFQEYRKGETPKVRNQLMQLNLGLVRKEARRWEQQCNESYEDLLQVGCMGLLRAIERFDLSKGNSFSSFAVPYIRGEIQHYLRDKVNSVKIPRRCLEIGRQAATVVRDFRNRFKRQPTDSEIAQVLEISLKEWEEVKLAYQNREPLSLDVSIGCEEDESNLSLGDLVPDGQYRSFQLAQEDKIRLQNALAELEDRTREVLEFVFLQDLTQKEAAERLGISVVTVSRRVKKGVERLKKVMTQE